MHYIMCLESAPQRCLVLHSDALCRLRDLESRGRTAVHYRRMRLVQIFKDLQRLRHTLHGAGRQGGHEPTTWASDDAAAAVGSERGHRNDPGAKQAARSLHLYDLSRAGAATLESAARDALLPPVASTAVLANVR